MYLVRSIRLALLFSVAVFSISLSYAQNVKLAPTALNFGKQPVGVISAPKTIIVTNTGIAALLISGVATTGDYAANNQCPGSLAPANGCTISVSFTPSAAGKRSGALTITDNAPGGTQSVPLTGVGVSAIVVAPTKLAFGNSVVGVTALPKSVKVTNNLSRAVSLSNMATSSADFGFQNGCGAQVPAKSSCSLTVTFTPTAVGARSGTLTFSDDTEPPTQSVHLAGTGLAVKLLSISVHPAGASVGIGSTQQYQAIGTYSNNTTSDITSSVVWKTTDPSIATVGAATGLLTGIKGGVTIVSATQGSRAKAITGSTTVTIIPVLNSITVTPGTATVAAGIAQQFAATGNYNDGSQRDLTTTATWTSSNPAVASVSAAGLAASAQPGQTSIAATVGPLSGTALLTVNPAALASLSVAPGVVFVGVGSNRQYSATGTFTDGSTRNVTSSVIWSSDNPSLATIDSFGLGTSTGDGAAHIIATAGTISGSATMNGIAGGFVDCDARILDMKVLVVTNAKAEADFPAITQALDYLGTPYTVLDISTTGLTIPAGFLSNGCHGYFQGVIFGVGNSIYNISNAPDLYAYESQFSVRQLNWFVFPDPNFGVAWVGSIDPNSTPYNFHYTAAADSIFPYANTANPVGIVDATIYQASAVNSTPLLTDDSGNVLATIYNTPFAYQYLSLTFDSNPFLKHDLVLSYGLINWVTQGMFLGQHHTYFTPQVDDYFIDDSEWTPGLDCSTNPDGTGTTIRIKASDLTALINWQAAKQSNPVSANFVLSMAFNGAGAVLGAYPNDDLTPATQANQASFNWISHTFDHTNLDNVTYGKASSEITQNNAMAATLGLANFNVANMVTPDISGLSNPNFLQAAADNGIRFLVSDTSRPGQDNPSPNVGIVNQYQPSILEIPRHANNLFFNVATPDDWVAEYNCIYPELGYSYPQILDNISDTFVVNMLRGDMDPEMFHQPNLQAYNGTNSLLGDLVDMTFTKYTDFVNFPILSPPEDAIGTEMANRSKYNLAGVSASFIPHQRIMVTAQQTTNVPVTGLPSVGAENYGGQTITHIALIGGQTVTLPVP
ncbi:MAG: choice-of-anchor D domain-containing protein [Acidobacteria bacterium]|nr:choice-of-anchor D domain-containing protein [Acidobacteriota bacterium]